MASIVKYKAVLRNDGDLVGDIAGNDSVHETLSCATAEVLASHLDIVFVATFTYMYIISQTHTHTK